MYDRRYLAVAAVLFSHVQDIFNDGWEIGDQNYEQTEEVIDPEYQNRIYVDYAWADYLGDELSEVDWEEYVNDYFTEATDGELEQLSTLTAEPGICVLSDFYKYQKQSA